MPAKHPKRPRDLNQLAKHWSIWLRLHADRNRLVDLDNDGRLDLHVTNGFPYDPNVDVVKRQRSAESMSESIRIMTESPIRAEKHIAMRNLGNLQFEDVSADWGLDQRG